MSYKTIGNLIDPLFLQSFLGCSLADDRFHITEPLDLNLLSSVSDSNVANEEPNLATLLGQPLTNDGKLCKNVIRKFLSWFLILSSIILSYGMLDFLSKWSNKKIQTNFFFLFLYFFFMLLLYLEFADGFIAEMTMDKEAFDSLLFGNENEYGCLAKWQ